MPSWALFLEDRSDGGGRLPMAVLRQIAMHAGGGRPRSYLQGGNLAIEAEPDKIDGVAKVMRATMDERIHPGIALVVRSGTELAAIADRCPFADTSRDGRDVHIGFLDTAPDASAAEALTGEDPERIAVLGTEVYVHHTDAASKQNRTPEWFAEKLGVKGAFRTWNTIREMRKLAPPEPDAGPGLGGRVQVVLRVSDLAASRAFYGDVLGLDVIEDAGRTTVRAGALVLSLEAGTPTTGAGLRFTVSDLAESRKVLTERGVALTEVEGGVSLTDPDGLEIQLLTA